MFLWQKICACIGPTIMCSPNKSNPASKQVESNDWPVIVIRYDQSIVLKLTIFYLLMQPLQRQNFFRQMLLGLHKKGSIEYSDLQDFLTIYTFYLIQELSSFPSSRRFGSYHPLQFIKPVLQGSTTNTKFSASSSWAVFTLLRGLFHHHIYTSKFCLEEPPPTRYSYQTSLSKDDSRGLC